MKKSGLILSLMSGAVLPAPLSAAQTVEDLPIVTQLANPFEIADGTLVRTTDDWQRRREELKRLFEQYEYGSLPPRPESMTIDRGPVLANEQLGVWTQDLILRLAQGSERLDLHVRLAVPLTADGPVPAIIQSGYGGGPPPPPRPNAPPRSEPTEPSLYTSHGYATASFRFSEAAADNPNCRKTGIYALFGADIDTGGLMAWAWGIHRVVDALETIAAIDSTKIAVMGHSRNGKAALVAGAFDERIALTIPNHSGCGGAAPYRFIYGESEQLQNIVNYAPRWFKPDFDRFIDHVERLPVDQHLLKALVAPRGLLSTEGTEDRWTNPEGSQLTNLAAREVYSFLGVEDRISLCFRPVGHIIAHEDIVAFMDHIFFGQPLSTEFGQLAYPVETAAYDWKAPPSVE